MKKRGKTIAIIIIFLLGFSLLLYPFVANKWNSYRQSRLMSNYEDTIARMEEEGTVNYESEKEKAIAYNDSLRPSILPDSFAVESAKADRDEAYMSVLNVAGDSVMGIIEIPKINVKLPILHTTTEEVLERAAGHLQGSSLPIGGESNHAVITAHRGLPSATLFTDLDQLVEGDHFLIRVLNDTLCYEVDQILEVKPEETQALGVEAGKDYVTLVTCTPYGVNTHRMLVRGHRVEYSEEALADEVPKGNVSLRTNYSLWVIIGIVITGVFILLLYLRDRKLRGKKAGMTAPVGETLPQDAQNEDAQDKPEKKEEDVSMDQTSEEEQ